MKKCIYIFILFFSIWGCVNTNLVFASSYSNDLLEFIKGRTPTPQEEKPAVVLYFFEGVHGKKIDKATAIPLYTAQMFEIDLLSKGKFDELIEFCYDVIKQYQDLFTYSRLARAYEFMDKADEAIEVYKKAINAAPTEPMPFFNLWGIYKFDKNDDVQAKIYLDKFEDTMLKKSQESKDYIIELIIGDAGEVGDYLANEEKPSKGVIKYYKMILYLNPNSQSAYAVLGMLYRKWGEFEEAGKYLQKALTLDPSDTWSHSNLCRVYRETGKIEEAKEELRTVIKILNEQGNKELVKAFEEELKRLEASSQKK